jgi:hypothetical protein
LNRSVNSVPICVDKSAADRKLTEQSFGIWNAGETVPSIGQVGTCDKDTFERLENEASKERAMRQFASEGRKQDLGIFKAPASVPCVVV